MDNIQPTHVCKCDLPGTAGQPTDVTKEESLIIFSVEPNLEILSSSVEIVTCEEYV
jgi:hypothetical protein